jgi:hypothetical protein
MKKHSKILKITFRYFRDRKGLKSTPLAKKLMSLMLKKALKDVEYAEKLDLWLSCKKSTTFLRDELVNDFKEHKMFQNLDWWSPFGNSWTALDSARMLRTKEQYKEILGVDILSKGDEIVLKNGKVMIFSHYTDFDNPVFILDEKHKLTILDDVIYSLSYDYEEPNFPLNEEYQSEIFETKTYNFYKGYFEPKESL